MSSNNLENFPDFYKGKMYEYEGTVTQLAVSSEVASIGIKFTGRMGERYKILRGRLRADSLAAVKKHQIMAFTGTGGFNIEEQEASLNDQWMQMGQSVLDNVQAVNTSNMGFIMPHIMGGNQLLYFQSNDTLDALKTIKVYLVYISTQRNLSAAVIGAGIAITDESHIRV